MATSTRGKKSSFKSTTVDPTQPVFQLANKARATSTHIFFWSGPLSNWHQGSKYPGRRALAILQTELLALGLTCPPTNTFTARLISDHSFNCGEQWMMAMKAWFFERDLKLGEETIGADAAMTEIQYKELKTKMYAPRLPDQWAQGSKQQQMWAGTLCSVLRTKSPKDQKELGRSARCFDEKVWSAVNMACVFAACAARAEVDPLLKRMYLEAGSRHFVEGSPRDVIWGVGLHWQSREIEDTNLWAGENRLGLCHDRAAEWMRSGQQAKDGEGIVSVGQAGL